MLGYLGGFKGLVQFKKCLIDNTTFRLHYQYTFAILCISSLLTTAKQYFGDPIDCIVEGIPGSKKIHKKKQKNWSLYDYFFLGVFKTYCWIHGTFTLPSKLTGKLKLSMMELE